MSTSATTPDSLPYADLVRELATGAEVDIGRVMVVCAAAHKTLADLEHDVTTAVGDCIGRAGEFHGG